jgi:hypothetical protein
MQDIVDRDADQTLHPVFGKQRPISVAHPQNRGGEISLLSRQPQILFRGKFLDGIRRPGLAKLSLPLGVLVRFRRIHRSSTAEVDDAFAQDAESRRSGSVGDQIGQRIIGLV